MFHSLCRRFDRHIFPLFITEVYGGTRGMEGNREIDVVIDGRITMGYSYFTYTPVPTVEFCFSLVER